MNYLFHQTKYLKQTEQQLWVGFDKYLKLLTQANFLAFRISSHAELRNRESTVMPLKMINVLMRLVKSSEKICKFCGCFIQFHRLNESQSRK